jgi:Flp pilus assembly protein TadG
VVEHRRANDRVLLLRERGTIIIESLAAMAVFFMLLVIVVQLAFVLVAHQTLTAAVDAAARRAARPAADLAQIEDRLASELASVVPGAQTVEASVAATVGTVDVEASIVWAPPGPDLVPVTIRSRASVPRIIPP